MAEKHATVTVPASPTWQKFLQQLWNFVNSTQSGMIQFVTEGGNIAVKTDGGFWNGSDNLASGFGSDNDYIVIEPVNEYPGGGKWQCKFKALDHDDDETDDCTVEVSWLGGYDTSADDFPGANQTSGALTYPVGYPKMASGDTWYFSCSNSDSYTNNGGIQTYTYFRVLIFDSNGSENTRFSGTYVGGYIPIEVNDDTKPVCLFTRIMIGIDNSSAWADNDSTHTLAPGDYAHSTSGGNVSCTIPVSVNEYNFNFAISRSGNWVNGPMPVLDNANDTTLGVFGKYTLLRGTGNSYQRSDGASDSNNLYKVAGDTMFRWNTAA
tara:strand:- start:3114 stop:4079 length:966 start_codon:yes stop_codon:yes gene_type:complete